jgi:hypothetical protein
MEKDIGKINKGEYQGTVTDIVIGIREFNERIGVDIREFVTSEGYTGPTKKGLRIPAEKFKEFKEMINSITEEDMKEESKEEKEKLPKEQATLDEEMPDY